MVYHDGSRGTVRGGLWIHGKPHCIRNLFYLNGQISAAKELVLREVSLSKRISKEEMLRIVYRYIYWLKPCTESRSTRNPNTSKSMNRSIDNCDASQTQIGQCVRLPNPDIFNLQPSPKTFSIIPRLTPRCTAIHMNTIDPLKAKPPP